MPYPSPDDPIFRSPERLPGLIVGGLGAGAGQSMTGITLAGFGAGAGRELTGIAIAGLGAGAGENVKASLVSLPAPSIKLKGSKPACLWALSTTPMN